MVIGVHRRAVGVFPNRRDVEGALHELRDSGFPMDRVSVIKRDSDGNDDIAGAEVRDTVGNKADEGATVGAVSGGALGGLTGLLVGLGTLAIPGLGPIMLAGATATAIATTLAGAGIGAAAGGLLGSLVGLGIPEEEARVYNERVQRGNYLVIIDGTVAEIARAEEILNRRGVEEFAVYERPGTDTTGIATNRGLTKNAVGYFQNRNDAEDAINALAAAGFPLSQISLVHREPQSRPFAGVSIRDRFDAMRLGLPDARARFYNDRVAHGDYVVTVSGTEDDINHAAAILSRHGIQEWEMYDPTAINSPVGNTTTLQRARRAVGVFPHRRDAEAAIRELRDAGFSMDQVSLLAKDTDGGNIAGADRLAAGNKAGESAAAGAATGGALGGLGGLLIGLGALAIPGIGPVIAGGAVATALATAVTGGAIGAAAGGLTGGLVGLGIPENRARVYSDRINRGDYVVFVDGTDDEVRRAEAILRRRGIEEFETFDQPIGTRTTAGTGSIHSGTKYRRAVGVFPHRRDAEAAIRELRDAGFSMDQVSLLAKDTDGGNIAGADRLAAGNKAGESAAAGAATGGALGGLGGLLIGLGALAIPGIGPVIAGGAVATALATAVTGGAIGAAAGGLTGGLVGLGIPENRARVYSDRINRGDYVVFVDGTDDEVRRAEAILRRRGIEEFETFDQPDVQNRTTDFTRTNPAIDGIGASPMGYAVTPDPISGIGASPMGYAAIPETMTGIGSPSMGYTTPETMTGIGSPPIGYAASPDTMTGIGSTPAYTTSKRAIGVFPHRRDAEAALSELRDSGFSMNQISLIAKDADGSDRIAGMDKTIGAGNKADEGAAAGAATGGALGGLGGLLVGLGTLAIPGIGPVMASGAIATAIATALTGGAIGAAAGGLTGGLVGLGIPENRAQVYSDRINRGEYVIFVDGTNDEVRRAEEILKRRGIQEFEIFDGDRDRVVSETSVVHPTYSTGVTSDSPSVIIIDNRDQTV